LFFFFFSNQKYNEPDQTKSSSILENENKSKNKDENLSKNGKEDENSIENNSKSNPTKNNDSKTNKHERKEKETKNKQEKNEKNDDESSEEENTSNERVQRTAWRTPFDAVDPKKERFEGHFVLDIIGKQITIEQEEVRGLFTVG